MFPKHKETSGRRSEAHRCSEGQRWGWKAHEGRRKVMGMDTGEARHGQRSAEELGLVCCSRWFQDLWGRRGWAESNSPKNAGSGACLEAAGTK